MVKMSEIEFVEGGKERLTRLYISRGELGDKTPQQVMEELLACDDVDEVGCSKVYGD